MRTAWARVPIVVVTAAEHAQAGRADQVQRRR